MRKVFSTIAICLIALIAPLRAEFAYVANFSSDNISAYRVKADGALKQVPGSPFQTGKGPFALAVDLGLQFLYVGGLGDSIWAYRIGEDGALTPVPGSPFPNTGGGASAVALDLLNHVLYVANSDNTVSGLRISDDGALTPVPGSPFATGFEPISVAVDLLRRFVYTATQGNSSSSGVVWTYRIGSDGSLTPVAGSPFPVGTFSTSLAVDLVRPFLYMANPLSETVSGFRIGKEGALTPVPGSPFAPGSFPSSVAIAPPLGLGRFVYVGNLGNPSTVLGFRIKRDGALTPVPGSPFLTGNTPGRVAVDLFGRFVYTVNDNNISGFHIGSMGSLSPVPGSPFAAGAVPSSMAFSEPLANLSP